MTPIDTTAKAFDFVVNNPTGPLFDPLAQKIVALALVVFLLM